MDALIEWNKKKVIDKKYANFQKHMRVSYHSLNQVGALTIEDSSISQINMIQELTAQQEKNE